jgi:hypothetical protein
VALAAAVLVVAVAADSAAAAHQVVGRQPLAPNKREFLRKVANMPEMCIVIGYNRNLDITYTTKRSTFQVNKRDHKICLRDKQNLEARLVRKQYEDQPKSMFKDSNIHYQIAERTRAIGCGGIGALHKLVCELRLDRALNKNTLLLRRHVPYWESDHVRELKFTWLSQRQALPGPRANRQSGERRRHNEYGQSGPNKQIHRDRFVSLCLFHLYKHVKKCWKIQRVQRIARLSKNDSISLV